MRSFTRRRLIITVIVFCWMSLLSLAVTIMLRSAHFADVDVVLWTIEDGPAHMARIRLVTTDAPPGPLQVDVALIVCGPEGDRTVDTRRVTVTRITVQSCKENDLSGCRLYGVTRMPSGRQDSASSVWISQDAINGLLTAKRPWAHRLM